MQNAKRFIKIMQSTPTPSDYKTMCEGLIKAGVTKLDIMEPEITAFGRAIVLQPQTSIRNARRSQSVFRRRVQYQMTWLQGAAIHMYTVHRA